MARVPVDGGGPNFNRGRAASVAAGSSGHLPVIYVAPPSGDGTGATDAVAITNAITALNTLAGGKGILQFQPGVYFDNTQRNLEGATSITFRGTGGMSGGAAPGTSYRYVGTTAPHFILRSTSGFQWQDMQYVQTNAGMSGFCFDFSHGVAATDSNNILIERSGFAGQRTAPFFNLDKINNATFRDVPFSNGLYAVRGTAGGGAGQYSVGVKFEGNCSFTGFAQAPIQNPGDAWHMAHPIFEPLNNGNAGAIICPNATCRGMSIDTPWFGDVTNGSGIWIDMPFTGLEVHGGVMGGGAYGINVQAGSTGLHLHGGLQILGTGGAHLQAAVNIDPSIDPATMIVDPTVTITFANAAVVGPQAPTLQTPPSVITGIDAAWSTTAPAFFLNAGSTKTASGTAARVVTTAGATQEGIAYALGILPAGTYRSSIYYRGNAGGEAIQFRVGVAGGAAVTVLLTGATYWQRAVTTFVADGTTNCYAVMNTQGATAVTFFADSLQVAL